MKQRNKKRGIKVLSQIFKTIKPRYFLIIFLVLATISVVALRSNNEHMLLLRNKVFAADKANGNVQQALNNLQAYVVRHMNTNLDSGTGGVYPPIQLKYTYNRLMAAQSQQVAKTNANLYTSAQLYCQKKVPVLFSGIYRVPCIEKYVQQHGAQLQPIPSALYQFDFVSPTWSPDLAGFSLLLSLIALLLFIFSLISSHYFKRKNYKS